MPSRKPCYLTAALLLLAGSLFAVQSPAVQKPVTKSELMALVAGTALPENIIHEVQTRGMAFHADDTYKAHLKTAGADGTVISAVEKAKPAPAMQQSESQTENDLVAHLANASKLMRARQYEEATMELTSALQEGADAEAGFVMGEVLSRQEQYEMAASVYQRVLVEAPDFPEAHTKLALSLYRTEDYGGAMREAKLALLRTPENAEAHKNLGLALMGMRKLDASAAEYREALRIKPNYAIVHYDLGLVQEAKMDLPGAIQEFKKSIALDSENAAVHYRLAMILQETGDTEGTIREYQEAKRVSPDRVDVRQDLALALAEIDLDASIREFHELIAMAPDFELAHVGLGRSLSRKGNLTAAEAEYRKAMALDPSDAQPHNNLGYVFERQKKYDAAMDEFQRAEQLDANDAKAHWGAGRIYLQRKEFAQAERELRLATTLNASLWAIHVNLAEALAGTGNLTGAIAEMKQAQAIDPRNAEIMSKFALLLEKSGDINGALEQYRLAAETGRTEQARSEYAMARKRLHGKDGSAQASPASNEVATSKAKTDGTDPESQWNDALDASQKALNERRYPDAEKAAKTALEVAETLRPRDQRLLRSIYQVAWVYSSEQNYQNAQTVWQRYLIAAQEINGPESREEINALDALASCAYELKDFATAENYFARSIELSEKMFGPMNFRAKRDFYYLANSYQAQGAFAKAESIFLQLMKMNSADGSDGLFVQGDLLQLGRLYLAWGKLDKAETYCRKALASREQSFGPDSPMLVDSMQTLSEVLGRLGKSEEAAQLKKRQQTILANAGQSVPKP